MAKEIPVYLFVGFLESGKTKFIQETFEDPNFDSGDKTLLLVCEEGEEEYNEKKFAFPGVTLKVLEDKAELNPQNLARLEKESGAGRVVIEYNGMWLLQDLANNLPENWIVYQCIATADGTTALTYARDNSMRSLLLDKIARSELIVFNRAEAVNNDAARQELHKLVRQASRKCDIAYEFADGSVAYDDIPDPLPFDLNAPIVEIGEDDFGIWYMDCQDEPQKYVGKTPLVLDEVLDPGLPYVECDSDERLGPDRAAADIAAIAKYGAPLVVLDFGTATTLDAVSREGVYLGGCITAGVQVSIDGLFQKTALLPRVELVKPDTVLSTTAVGQIQAGAVLGYIGAIEYLIRHAKEEIGQPDTKVVATGGLSRLVADNTELIDVVDPQLVLDGLRIIYERARR